MPDAYAFSYKIAIYFTNVNYKCIAYTIGAHTMYCLAYYNSSYKQYARSSLAAVFTHKAVYT